MLRTEGLKEVREAISTNVREGRGTVGTLLSDEGLGNKLNETVRDVSIYLDRLTQLQTEVGIRSEYLLTQGRTKNALSLRPGVVVKNCAASVVPGCTPDAPYAVRRRSWLRKFGRGKNDSSEITHERAAFG